MQITFDGIATITAALITVIAGLCILSKQLNSDRFQRKRDRALELKKELYLEVVTSLMRVSTTVIKFADYETPIPTNTQIYTESIAHVYRLLMVADIKVIELLFEYVALCGDSQLSILKKRIPKRRLNESNSDLVNFQLQLLDEAICNNIEITKKASHLILLLRRELDDEYEMETLFNEKAFTTYFIKFHEDSYSKFNKWVDELKALMQ